MDSSGSTAEASRVAIFRAGYVADRGAANVMVERLLAVQAPYHRAEAFAVLGVPHHAEPVCDRFAHEVCLLRIILSSAQAEGACLVSNRAQE